MTTRPWSRMEALRKQREEYTLAKNKLMLRITTAEAWALHGQGALLVECGGGGGGATRGL